MAKTPTATNLNSLNQLPHLSQRLFTASWRAHLLAAVTLAMAAGGLALVMRARQFEAEDVASQARYAHWLAAIKPACEKLREAYTGPLPDTWACTAKPKSAGEAEVVKMLCESDRTKELTRRLDAFRRAACHDPYADLFTQMELGKRNSGVVPPPPAAVDVYMWPEPVVRAPYLEAVMAQQPSAALAPAVAFFALSLALLQVGRLYFAERHMGLRRLVLVFSSLLPLAYCGWQTWDDRFSSELLVTVLLAAPLLVLLGLVALRLWHWVRAGFTAPQ